MFGTAAAEDHGNRDPLGNVGRRDGFRHGTTLGVLWLAGTDHHSGLATRLIRDPTMSRGDRPCSTTLATCSVIGISMS